jgi:biopolymer transport protein ExbD
MRIPNSHFRSDISENMMTPMIDVVFNLLIFFVCAAASATYEELLPADLADSGAVAAAQVTPVVPKESRDEIWVYLRADANGRSLMNLNGTDYETFDGLKEVLLALAEVAPETPVILDIAPDVTAGEMIKVYDTCRAAKFEKVHFNARPESLERQP